MEALQEFLLLVGGLVALPTIIQISPLKLDPWTTLLKAIGKSMNGELLEKVDKLEQDIISIREDAEEQAIVTRRARILRFGDEIMHGVKHSKDHFDQTLSDITEYERYCSDHKNFKNNITALTSSRIKEVYQTRLEKNDFL